jgi:hypothetical protein
MSVCVRWLLAVLLVACTNMHGDPPGNPGCPGPQSGSTGDVVEGSQCGPLQNGMLCFVEDTFSSCASAWYRCALGTWRFDHPLGAEDGQSCADAPLQACFTEGVPGCDTPPTSESCNCGSDGLWHCDCACYGGQTTCPYECPPAFPGVGTNGPLCATPGSTCPYPDHTCTCASDGHFSCT